MRAGFWGGRGGLLVVSSKRKSTQPGSVYLGCEGKRGRVRNFLTLCALYSFINAL